MRTEDATIERRGRHRAPSLAPWRRAARRSRPWTVLRGRDSAGQREIVVNDYASRALGVEPGATVTLRAVLRGRRRGAAARRVSHRRHCRVPVRYAGSVRAGTTASALDAACGAEPSRPADFIVVDVHRRRRRRGRRHRRAAARICGRSRTNRRSGRCNRAASPTSARSPRC